MHTSFERHFYYWILPTFYITTVALLYFTGIPLLQTIVAPDVNRELGLLESTQHLLILGVIGMGVYGLRGAQVGMEKLGFTLVIFLGTIQFLEEINYGQHYLIAFSDDPEKYRNAIWSVHNQGISSPLKRVGDAVILLYFFLFPLLAGSRWPAWLRYLAPPRLIALTVLVSVLVTKFFHFVSDNTPVNNSAFITGVSEFRETFIYYFVLVYVRELAMNRRWPGFSGNGVIQRES